MESLRFCSRCGGILEKGFLFCPYCGVELTVLPLSKKSIEGPFDILEIRSRAVSFRRLEGCEDALTKMENELDSFLDGKGFKN